MRVCLVLGLSWLVLALTPDAPAASPPNGVKVGRSSVADVQTWPGTPRAHVSASPCGHPRQDATYDGIVDLADFREFAECVTATTPLQALTTLNHTFTLDMACAMAMRIESETDDDSKAQLNRAFELCFGRQPTAEEATQCIELIQAHGLAAVCRVLLNTSELIYLL